MISALVVTKPDKESFYVAMEDSAREGGVLSGLVSLGKAYLLKSSGMVEYEDYVMFALININSRVTGRHSTHLLGVLGMWFDVSLVDDVPGWLRRVPKCQYGVGTPGIENCICLPGYKGSKCNTKISGFVSVWDSLLRPFLGRIAAVLPQWQQSIAVYAKEKTVLGVPVDLLPPSVVKHASSWGLVDVSKNICLLDLLLIAMLHVALLWGLFAAVGLSDWMHDHFTASWRKSFHPLGLYTLFTSQLSHLSIIHLLSNIYALLVHGPVVYQALGSDRMAAFVYCAFIGSAIGSLLYVMVVYGRHAHWTARSSASAGWQLIPVVGASGWLFAFRTMTVLVESRSFSRYAKMAGFVSTVDWRIFWENLAPAVVIESIFLDPLEMNFGGMLGGVVAALGFAQYAKI